MTGRDDEHRLRLRDWQFLLLRFAVTHAPSDRSAAFAAAAALDSAGGSRDAATPTFFQRTSRDICAAILTPHDPRCAESLRQHCRRIDDERLRRAFAAVLLLERRPRGEPKLVRAGDGDLWKGLASRS